MVVLSVSGCLSLLLAVGVSSLCLSIFSKPCKRAVAAKLPQSLKKRRQWSDETMVLAMEAVKSGRFGVNEAARTYIFLATPLIIALEEEWFMGGTKP